MLPVLSRDMMWLSMVWLGYGETKTTNILRLGSTMARTEIASLIYLMMSPSKTTIDLLARVDAVP